MMSATHQRALSLARSVWHQPSTINLKRDPKVFKAIVKVISNLLQRNNMNGEPGDQATLNSTATNKPLVGDETFGSKDVTPEAAFCDAETASSEPMFKTIGEKNVDLC